MFGFGKLVKRHKLSVAEEAELAIIQLLSLKTITDIVSQKTFQPFLKICLRKGWNAPNNYSNGLRQGIFNKSYDFLITLTNIIVNLFKTILFVT